MPIEIKSSEKEHLANEKEPNIRCFWTKKARPSLFKPLIHQQMRHVAKSEGLAYNISFDS